MDAMINSEPTHPQSDGVASSICEKRPIENGENEEPTARSSKKPRCGPRDDMKRVAEIVLVLSAMGRMRGGKSPTDAEVGLMAEARAKLAEMCLELAPKDIVDSDAIGTVIDDLGLNGKLKDQRLGFRGPKLTISEKVALAKRKMDESKKFTSPSTTFSSHSLQSSLGAAGERSNMSPIGSGTHTVCMLPTDKANYAPVTSGGFPASIPPVHITAATNTSLPHHLPTGEVKVSTVSVGLPSGHFTRDSSSLALPRVERPHVKLEGGFNGSTGTSQMSAISSANHPLVNAPTWSVQHPSVLAKSAIENKVSNNTLKVEGSTDSNVSRMSQAGRDQSFRPFITQTALGNFPGINQPFQGMNLAQASSFGGNHNEIAKIVQKLLQPQLPQHPTWNPPSREYMNKALTCQICKVTVHEVDTVLICDACEKGFHLKCLQSNNLKGIPKPEWHCSRCLQLCNGKPLPPKYGRVMRSANAPKVPSSTSGVQSPSDNKVGPVDPKISQQKISANGSPGLKGSAGSGAVGSNCGEPVSDLKSISAKEMQGNNLTSSKTDMDQRISSTNSSNNSAKSLETVGASLPNERSNQHPQNVESSANEEKPVSESEGSKPQSHSGLAAAVRKSDHSQLSHDTHKPAEVSLGGEPIVNDSEGGLSKRIRREGDSTLRTKEAQLDVALENHVESSGTCSGDGKHDNFASKDAHGVEWNGDVIQVVGEKKCYGSCCINGITYTVQDHVLFHSGRKKLIPSKLQAMWEDVNTGLKWVVVNRCYFPNDLPEAVGRPSPPESNEVYESNNCSTMLANVIQGPCLVLPGSKFKEENERRSRFGAESKKPLPPVFLCKWFYDEFKRTFQPVFS